MFGHPSIPQHPSFAILSDEAFSRVSAVQSSIASFRAHAAALEQHLQEMIEKYNSLRFDPHSGETPDMLMIQKQFRQLVLEVEPTLEDMTVHFRLITMVEEYLVYTVLQLKDTLKEIEQIEDLIAQYVDMIEEC